MRKLFISLVVSIVVLFNLLPVNAVAISADAIFNTAQIESGIVKVSYDSDTDKKLKVLVQKSDKKIYYNLNNDGIIENFPLQYGNGEYKISLLENTTGSKYKYISSKSVSLALEDQTDVYLGSIQNINWNKDMAAIIKAKELTAGLKNDQEKVKAIYNYIVNNVRYDYNKLKTLKTDYVPNIDSTLKSNTGICYDFASTLAAMLRSVGIPAKLVKGYSKTATGYHAWNEVYNSETNKWEIIDATYDSQMRVAKVKYTMIKKSNLFTKVNEY